MRATSRQGSSERQSTQGAPGWLAIAGSLALHGALFLLLFVVHPFDGRRPLDDGFRTIEVALYTGPVMRRGTPAPGLPEPTVSPRVEPERIARDAPPPTASAVRPTAAALSPARPVEAPPTTPAPAATPPPTAASTVARHATTRPEPARAESRPAAPAGAGSPRAASPTQPPAPSSVAATVASPADAPSATAPSAPPAAGPRRPSSESPLAVLEAPRTPAPIPSPPAGRAPPASATTTARAVPPAAAVAPREARREGTEVRLEAVLGTVACGRVSAALDDGRVRLQGHVPDDEARRRLLATIGTLPQVATVDDSALVMLPRPYCSMLETLERTGVHPSRFHTASPDQLGREAQAAVLRFREGQRLVIEAQSPSFEAHLYLSYFQKDGAVVHLLPGPETRDAAFAPGTPLKVGGPAGLGPELVVAPPFGLELLVAIASSRRLFDTPRPAIEPADGYLDALADAIARAEHADAGFLAEYVYLFVVTEP
jgi:hypothetical protein